MVGPGGVRHEHWIRDCAVGAPSRSCQATRLHHNSSTAARTHGAVVVLEGRGFTIREQPGPARVSKRERERERERETGRAE